LDPVPERLLPRFGAFGPGRMDGTRYPFMTPARDTPRPGLSRA